MSNPLPRVNEYESLSPLIRRACWLVDRAGRLLCSLLPKRKTFDPAQAKRILVARLDGLGDVVLSIPALRALRHAKPDSEIVLLVGPWAQGIAAKIPYVDRVEVHAPWSFRAIRNRDFRPLLGDARRFYRRMREEKFDAGLDLRGDFLSLVILWWIGLPAIVGRGTRGGGFLATHRVAVDLAATPHEIDRALRAVAVFGADPADHQPELPVPPDDAAKSEQLLRECGIRPGERFALIGVGALWRYKRWPAERFVELIRQLRTDHGLRCAVVGNAGERELTSQIAAQAPGTIDLGGRTDLGVLAGLLARATIYVGNDSGPGQLAMASRCPCVIIFGPGRPLHFGPARQGAIAVYEPCGPTPCFEKGECSRLPDWCLQRVEVERVMTQVRGLLADAKS